MLNQTEIFGAFHQSIPHCGQIESLKETGFTELSAESSTKLVALPTLFAVSLAVESKQAKLLDSVRKSPVYPCRDLIYSIFFPLGVEVWGLGGGGRGGEEWSIRGNNIAEPSHYQLVE